MLRGLDATGTKDVTACCLRDVMQPFPSKWQVGASLTLCCRILEVALVGSPSCCFSPFFIIYFNFFL